MRFYINSTPGNQVKFWYFTQCKFSSIQWQFSVDFCIKHQSFLGYFIYVTNVEPLSASFSLLRHGERHFYQPSLFSIIYYVYRLINKLQVHLYLGLRSFTTQGNHTVYSHSFAQIRLFALHKILNFHAQNSAENMHFHKTFTLGNSVKLHYFAQCYKKIVFSAIFFGW